MNADERRACDGLDDASITETMEWLKEQCILLQFQLESAANILHDKRGAERLPTGGSEQ
jgi:hypothetical protein